MKRLAAIVLLAATGCSGGSAITSSTAVTIASTTTSTTTTTTSSLPAIPVCAPADFLPTVLPAGVAAGPSLNVPLDPFTSIPGTATSVWVDGDGEIALLLIRGALPPERWVDTPETITVRGTEAAMGELPGGHVGVAWFEGPDRCDDYSLILYPPETTETIRGIAESLFPES